MSGKEASGSNAAPASSSTTQLGHRKTAKNRNSTRKRTTKKNTKVVKITHVSDSKPEAAANSTAAHDKIEKSEQPASDDNKPKEDLEMTNTPEDDVIPKTEVSEQTEDREPAEGFKPKDVKAIEELLPTEDSKGAEDKIPDDEPTCVAETEEENLTAKALNDEKPQNVIDLTKEEEPADNAGTAVNTTAGKAAKKNKRRNRKTLKNRKRALNFGASGVNKPTVLASVANVPTASSSVVNKPTASSVAANEPTASSSAANEPTASTSEANETGTEDTARALSPSAMVLKQLEVDSDDDVVEDYDPEDRSNDERDWSDVQDGVWELYE